MLNQDKVNIPDSVKQFITITSIGDRLNMNSSYYSPTKNLIYIPLNKRYTGATYENLTDSELITFINSEINHEMIHYVIQKHINSISSYRFDLIAKDIRIYQFKNIRKILKKLGYHFKTKKEVKRQYRLNSDIKQKLKNIKCIPVLCFMSLNDVEYKQKKGVNYLELNQEE